MSIKDHFLASGFMGVSLTNQGKDYGLKLFADCVDTERGYGVGSLVCFSKIFE